MFQATSPKTRSRTAFQMLELVYHWTVRDITRKNRNPLISLLIEVCQNLIFIAFFLVMFQVIGMKRATPVGLDFFMFLLSGVFLFMTHTKTMGAVVSADGPTSAMMKHAPMNTTVAIMTAALSTLYMQLLTIGLILFGYHVLTGRMVIYDPVGAAGMFLLTWFSGVCVGLVFLSIRPFFPGLVNILRTAYQRVNMLFSGKMLLANTLPSLILTMFDWNPLFHLIDQCRGYVFLNYSPKFTSIAYPIKITFILLVIGLMGEFYARKNASLSKSI